MSAPVILPSESRRIDLNFSGIRRKEMPGSRRRYGVGVHELYGDLPLTVNLFVLLQNSGSFHSAISSRPIALDNVGHGQSLWRVHRDL